MPGLDHAAALLSTYGSVELKGKTMTVRSSASSRSDREALLFEVSKAIGGTVQASYRSSAGELQLPDFRIICKPSRLDAPSWRENELALNAAINEAVSSRPLSVIFAGPKKWVSVGPVVSSSMAHSRPTHREKADLALKTEHGSFGVSIKCDSAQFWESSERFYATRLMNSLPVKSRLSILDSGLFRIQKALAFQIREASPVLGTDISPGEGLIAIRTFTPDDFERQGDSLAVKVSTLIEDEADLVSTVGWPWLLLGNNSTRRSKWLPPGLELKCVSENRVSSCQQFTWDLECDTILPCPAQPPP